MFNDVLWTLALIAAMTTGVSLPSVIASDYALVPLYQADTTAQVVVLPTPKLRRAPVAVNPDAGPTLQARAAIVMDKTSGAILWQKNPDAILPIASITKLMTALVAHDHITDWDQLYTMQWSDVSLGGSTFAGGVDDTFSKSDLLKTALVASANSAAAALAHSTGLSNEQFVEAMNAKAKLLGMQQTQYVEPTGLSANNVSSVKDLAMLLRTLTAYDRLLAPMGQIEHRMVKRDAETAEPLPDAQEIFTQTTNRLIKEHDPLFIAGKTGFTYEAGHCLASVARDAAGHDIIIILLGGVDETSRFTETHDLAVWAFEHHRWE